MTDQAGRKILLDRIVPAGKPWSGIVRMGQILRIIDVKGQQAVDFLCYNAEDPAERYNAPNTIKASKTLRLTKGHTLFSDQARPMLTIVEDTCGIHDTIGGCCSSWSNEMLYGVKDTPGCRENFLLALKSYDLGWKDIVPNVNFFCSVPVFEEAKLADTVFTEGRSKPGDYIDLRAEMNVICALSNCPQINNPCNASQPTEIRVMIRQADI